MVRDGKEGHVSSAEEKILFGFAVGTLQETLQGYTPPADDGRQRVYRQIAYHDDGMVVGAEIHVPHTWDNPKVGRYRIRVSVEEIEPVIERYETERKGT
jgi:hypothetical protein